MRGPHIILLLLPIRPTIRQRSLFDSRPLWAIYGPNRTYATDNALPPISPPTPQTSNYPPGGSSNSRGTGARISGLQRSSRSEKVMQPGAAESGPVAVIRDAIEMGTGTHAGHIDEVGVLVLSSLEFPVLFSFFLPLFHLLIS